MLCNFYSQNVIALLQTLSWARVTVMGCVSVKLDQLEATVRHAFKTTSRTRKDVKVNALKSMISERIDLTNNSL